MKKFKIKNIKIESNLVLAPMAGISNSAFRQIARECGAALVYAEMVSDKAIFYDNQKSLDMLKMEESERPIAQQIFGSDKESFVIAAKKIYEMMKPDIIDINMGCPVPKIALRSQAGSALLKNPAKIKEIVEAVVEAVPCPVTVKIRSGWDAKHINAVEVAKICEAAGASAICIHGRTRSQAYGGAVNLDIIKAVKEAVKIPVIGNGDIKDGDSAKKMFEYTGVDAIMIGRAAYGYPWIFKEILSHLNDEPSYEKPDYKERLEMCLKHISYLKKIKDDKLVNLESKAHIAAYIKSMPESSKVKQKIFQSKSLDETIEILHKYAEYLEKGEEYEFII